MDKPTLNKVKEILLTVAINECARFMIEYIKDYFS